MSSPRLTGCVPLRFGDPDFAARTGDVPMGRGAADGAGQSRTPDPLAERQGPGCTGRTAAVDPFRSFKLTLDPVLPLLDAPVPSMLALTHRPHQSPASGQ